MFNPFKRKPKETKTHVQSTRRSVDTSPTRRSPGTLQDNSTYVDNSPSFWDGDSGGSSCGSGGVDSGGSGCD